MRAFGDPTRAHAENAATENAYNRSERAHTVCAFVWSPDDTDDVDDGGRMTNFNTLTFFKFVLILNERTY